MYLPYSEYQHSPLPVTTTGRYHDDHLRSQSAMLSNQTTYYQYDQIWVSTWRYTAYINIKYILTLFRISTLAPACTNSWAISVWPLLIVMCNDVLSSYDLVPIWYLAWISTLRYMEYLNIEYVLTLFWISIFAPACTRSWAISRQPYLIAWCNAVQPPYVLPIC